MKTKLITYIYNFIHQLLISIVKCFKASESLDTEVTLSVGWLRFTQKVVMKRCIDALRIISWKPKIVSNSKILLFTKEIQISFLIFGFEKRYIILNSVSDLIYTNGFNRLLFQNKRCGWTPWTISTISSIPKTSSILD